MRNLLATAVALAPLMAATGVQAEVVISDGRTTPIVTSNATGSAADDIRLANGGSITLASGAAITVDSDNSVDLDSGSKITMDKADNGATAILVNAGNAGSITVGGTIAITDDYTAADDDEDGDVDGVFAEGTDRYGLRVTGPGTFTGDILIESTGAISVEGNDSYGVSVESDLVGDLTSLGKIQTSGDNDIGVSVSGDVTGNVNLLGSIATQGEAAQGAVISGDVSGRLTVQSAISTTGYRYSTRPSQTAIDTLDPDDLLQGGSALVVAGDVAGGVVLDTGPANTDTDDTDEDSDGIPDSLEGTSSISAFGAAPAVAVGSTDRDVTLGEAGAGDEAYGFINKGSISGAGVYDGVNGAGLRFGGTGHAVTIDGGVRNDGSVISTAYQADSTAMQFADGASTATVLNTGTISAGATTEGDNQALGLGIAAGASVGSIDNQGAITAGLGGEAGDAVAFQDLSGTVGTIRNSGSIQAHIAPTDDEADTDDADLDPANETITGRQIAIDVQANTTGVALTQIGVDDGDDDGDDATTDPDADGDGVDDADEPIIFGDVLLGSGADAVDIGNGQVLGDIAFGAGADTLDISGGALVRGALSDSDGQLDITVADGTLDARQTSRVDVSNLTVAADGDLIVTIDPLANTASGFNVSGTASLADGAGLGVQFASLIDDPERFTIIKAGTLDFGAIDDGTVQDNSPYLFVVSAGADVAAGEVYVDVRRRTAAEADLIPVESQAFDAVYDALGDNTALRGAFLSQTDRDGFINLYEQMLPDHSGGPLMSLASGVDAVTRALTGRNQSAAPGQTSAWVQEINFYADKDKTDTYGFRSEGFGVAGGVERGTNLGAIGVSAAFTSSDLEDPEAEAEENLAANLLELGLYWRAQGQYWTTWARAAGGYASFSATRQFIGEGVALSNESDWHGYTVAAAAGASYERTYGRYSLRPEVYAEYFRLSEGARTEEGGGDGFDLDIDSRDGHMFSATAALNFGASFGRDGWIKPELRVGWRQNISVDPGETIARFTSGGSDFTLTPDAIEGGGPLVGFRLNIGNALGLLSVEGNAELIEDYVRYSLLLRASFRF